MLIAAGSDVNTYIPESLAQMGHWSPLQMVVTTLPLAREFPDGLDVIDLLLKAGADPNPPEHWNQTVMEESVEMGLRRLWPVLLRAGAVLPTRVTPYQRRNTIRTGRTPTSCELRTRAASRRTREAHRKKVLATFTPKFAPPRSAVARRAAHRRVRLSLRLLLVARGHHCGVRFVYVALAVPLGQVTAGGRNYGVTRRLGCLSGERATRRHCLRRSETLADPVETPARCALGTHVSCS